MLFNDCGRIPDRYKNDTIKGGNFPVNQDATAVYQDLTPVLKEGTHSNGKSPASSGSDIKPPHLFFQTR